MSVPVLSWSLIGDPNDTPPARGGGRKAMAIHEFPRRGPSSPEDLPRPTNGSTRFLHKARSPRPSEPILIPKLRIQFADFPYLHYSIDQRLLTLETCCGYGYELARHHRNLPRIFKVPPTTRGCRENCGTLRQDQNPFSLR